MQAPAPTAIVPVRPVSAADPALYAYQGAYLLPRVMHNLMRQGLVSRVILSLSEAVPQAQRAILAQWGLDLELSASDLPQARLVEVMESHGLDAAMVLTPYAMLLDGQAMGRAWDLVQSGADAAYAEDVIASKFFMVLNRNAAQTLAKLRDYAVAPFAFAAKLRDSGLELAPIKGLESLAEQFLWELTYAGERSMLPADVLGQWLDATPEHRRHEQEAFHELLKSLRGVGDWQDMEPYLQRLKPIQSVKRLAMMVHYLERIETHIPRGGRFLEIGYGRTPVTSCLLARLFDSGVAVEPFNHHNEGFPLALEFCDFLARRHPSLLLPELPDSAFQDLRRRVAFHQARVEELALPDDSIDFCNSRMVFEHVMNPEELSGELYRILKPGGVMLHEIGFNDHDDLTCINFAFLRHSREQWAAMNKGTNLWRVNDFTRLWRELGFDVEILWREQRRMPPQSLHPSWSNYAEGDLYCYVALIRAVKQGS